jgi:putative hydrolase of the HAD superfamily
MPQPVDAVIFDWGGTLSHWIKQESVPGFWRAAAAKLDESRVDELVGRLIEAEEAVWAHVRGAQKSGRLSEIMAAAAQAHQLEVAEELFETATAAYLEAWELELGHKDDALPMLAALKSMGLKTALLSNTHWPRSFHEQLLERDGLAEYLDARVYTSDIGHVKPHPLAFKAALKAIDARPANTVFVGDRRYDDVFGAQSIGMRAVLVLPSPDDHDVSTSAVPDATIDSLTELIPVLDRFGVRGN